MSACAAVELDGDLAVTTEAPALTGNIRTPFQDAVPAYERRDTSVAASAHRVFRNPVRWGERPNLKIGLGGFGVQAKHVDARDANRVERGELTHVRRKRPHSVAARKLDRKPHGSDIDDGCALNVRRHDAKTIGDPDKLRPGWLAELRFWQREEQTVRRQS
jgi:hypothetical protein